MPEEAAPTIKQQLVEAWRSEDDLTPGVVEFLTAEIPMPPEINAPADEAAAIVANGIAAKYILDLFRPFAGLTPVEMILHIGQLNTVLQGAYLSGLEYLDASGMQNTLLFDAPKDGAIISADAAGTALVEILVKATNGDLRHCDFTVEIASNPGFAIKSGGMQAATESRFCVGLMLEPGEYILTAQGWFDVGSGETLVEASINLTITDPDDPNAPPPDPDDPTQPTRDNPTGDQAVALQQAFDACQAAYRKFMAIIAQSADHNAWNAAYQDWKTAIDKFTRIATAIAGDSALSADLGYLQAARADVATAIADAGAAAETATTAAGALQSVLQHMLTLVNTLTSK